MWSHPVLPSHSDPASQPPSGDAGAGHLLPTISSQLFVIFLQNKYWGYNFSCSFSTSEVYSVVVRKFKNVCLEELVSVGTLCQQLSFSDVFYASCPNNLLKSKFLNLSKEFMSRIHFPFSLLFDSFLGLSSFSEKLCRKLGSRQTLLCWKKYQALLLPSPNFEIVPWSFHSGAELLCKWYSNEPSCLFSLIKAKCSEIFGIIFLDQTH